MAFSAQQSDAVAAFSAWWNRGHPTKQVFRLFGLAGTGKTWLARHLIRIAGPSAVCAFTGKAASVLRGKGLPTATTVHKLIYVRPEKDARHPIEKLVQVAESLGVELLVDGDVVRMRMRIDEETGEPMEAPEATMEKLSERRDELHEFLVARDGKQKLKPADKETVEIIRKQAEKERLHWILRDEEDLSDVALIVLDECSMIGESLWRDLLTFNRPIIALGDPAQLPPVGGDRSPVIADGESSANVMLTEIMRQKADSGIPWLARAIRNGDDWRGAAVGLPGVRLARWPRDEWLVNHDQVICGTNRSRARLNEKIRQFLGYATDPVGLPKEGEKLICLRNNVDIGGGVMNGQQFEVLDAEDGGFELVDLVLREWGNEDAEEFRVIASALPFSTGEVDNMTARNLGQFTWGYAITAHKSQGSEWPSVLVIDEGGIFQQSAARWLYTAVTRSSSELTLCSGGPIATPCNCAEITA